MRINIYKFDFALMVDLCECDWQTLSSRLFRKILLEDANIWLRGTQEAVRLD